MIFFLAWSNVKVRGVGCSLLQQLQKKGETFRGMGMWNGYVTKSDSTLSCLDFAKYMLVVPYPELKSAFLELEVFEKEFPDPYTLVPSVWNGTSGIVQCFPKTSRMFNEDVTMNS